MPVTKALPDASPMRYRFFATVPKNMESLVVEELRALGYVEE